MIYQGSSSEALLKGEIKTTQGLGLIDNVIVDQTKAIPTASMIGNHFVHHKQIICSWFTYFRKSIAKLTIAFVNLPIIVRNN